MSSRLVVSRCLIVVLEASSGDQLALADDLLGLGDGSRAASRWPIWYSAWLSEPASGTSAVVHGTGPAELLTRCVDGSLRHQPERRGLAAGDGEEARDAFARRVVEERMRAGHVSRFRDHRGVLEERADAGPRMQGSRLTKSGDELLALVEEEVDVGLPDLGLVGIGDEHVGGADHACGAERQEDVTVRRSLASVDTHVDEAVVHRDHQAHPGTDVDRAVCELRDLPGPGTGRVDDNSGSNRGIPRRCARCERALPPPGRHRPRGRERGDTEGCAPRAPPPTERNPRPASRGPAAASGTRNARRISGLTRRLAAERLRDRDLLGWDAGRPAALEEQVAVLRVVPRRGHEHARPCPRRSPLR